MFNAIISLAEPIVAVQVDASQIEGPGSHELFQKLKTYFMRPVVMVAWDQDSRFISYGYSCPENLLTDEDLHWRQFELPPEPEEPF